MSSEQIRVNSERTVGGGDVLDDIFDLPVVDVPAGNQRPGTRSATRRAIHAFVHVSVRRSAAHSGRLRRFGLGKCRQFRRHPLFFNFCVWQVRHHRRHRRLCLFR